MDSKRYNYRTLAVLTLTADLGGFLFGYVTSVISGASLYLYDDLHHGTAVIKELVVSITLVGALVGSLCGGQLADKLGRKYTIAISDACFLVGAALMAFAIDIPMLVIGRLIAGIGVGITEALPLTAMVIPVYLAEVCPSAFRGILVTSNAFCINAGQLVSLLVCLALGNHWRWMLGMSAFLAAAQVCGLLLVPESPRWLLKVGRDAEGVAVMLDLYLSDAAASESRLETELQEVRTEVQKDPKASYFALLRELFSTSKKAVVVGAGLQALQQLVGINTAMYYGPTIMKSAGFNGSGQEALLASLPIFCAGFFGILIAVTVVEKQGRRWILLCTLPLVTLCLVGLAVGFVLIKLVDRQDAGGYVCLVCVIAYVASFGLGMSPVPWTVNSEIYPLHLRSVANSVSTATNWTFNIIVSMTFLSVTSSGGGQVAAWLVYAGFSVLAWFWVYFRLPETKGRTLQEILQLFAPDSPKEIKLLDAE